MADEADKPRTAGAGRQVEEILAHISDGLIGLDGDWRLTYVNPAAERMWRCTRDAVAGAPFFGALVADAGDPLRVACLDSKARGDPVALAVYAERCATWLIVRGYPHPSGYTLLMRDVGDERQAYLATIAAARAREAAREINQRLFETSLDLILVVDRRGNFIRVSPSAQAVIGYAPEEMVGRSAAEFLHPPDLEPTRAEMRLARRGRLMRNFECRYVHRNGGVVPLTWTGVWSEAEQQHFFIGRDMTERIAAEERHRRSQRLEAIGQLTGGIAHDFNNLLSVVIGNLDLLAERAGRDPGAAELVQSALAASLRGAELTRQLLAFARRQPLEPKVIALNQSVAATMELLRRTLGEQIEVATATTADLWPAFVDPAQFEAALVNLAINARDAMPEGGRLTIETANQPLDDAYARANADAIPGDYVMVAVSDTGAGMAPDVLARAFEPFFTTKQPGRGTGLGLSMVYGFTRQSRGHVKIYSEVGHGTTVRLYLPRAARADDKAAASPPEAPQPARGGERILVVEDNPDVRRVVVLQLRDLGYHIIEAANGEAALAVIEGAEPIDLLFSDVVMPGGMTGDELARRARLARPGLKVLLTSGFARAAMPAAAQSEDLRGLLSKPYRKVDLAARLRTLLDA
jgi:PAS domain S-box-containing protein